MPAPTITGVMFGITRSNSHSKFSIQGQNLDKNQDVTITSSANPNLKWEGKIKRQLPDGSWQADVKFTGTAVADDPNPEDVETLQIVVTSPDGPSNPLDTEADVYTLP